MVYYIIIRGPLGVGKSTVAKELARQLDASYISIDSILKENKMDTCEGEECIPLKNFIKANELILPLVKDVLARGKIVIFDGNFYHEKQIEHLEENIQGEHHVFTLKAPLEICIERDKGRKMAYGAGAATAVHNLVSRFDYGILIDTEHKDLKETIGEIRDNLP